MGVYNNNKDGTRSTLANTIQVVDAPMEQFLSRGEFSAVTPNDVSADNKLVAENEVTKAVDTMPTASADLVGTIVQYVGTTTANYTNGYFYKCVSDGAVTPTYSWVEVISGGSGEKEIVHVTEPPEESEIEDKIYELFEGVDTYEDIIEFPDSSQDIRSIENYFNDKNYTELKSLKGLMWGVSTSYFVVTFVKDDKTYQIDGISYIPNKQIYNVAYSDDTNQYHMEIQPSTTLTTQIKATNVEYFLGDSNTHVLISIEDSYITENRIRSFFRLDNLLNVNINLTDRLQNNDVLTYDETTNRWKNKQGTSVSVTPTLQSGTKIAEIDVNGTTTDIYAPNGGEKEIVHVDTLPVAPNIEDKIYEVGGNGTPYTLTMPQYSESNFQTYFNQFEFFSSVSTNMAQVSKSAIVTVTSEGRLKGKRISFIEYDPDYGYTVYGSDYQSSITLQEGDSLEVKYVSGTITHQYYLGDSQLQTLVEIKDGGGTPTPTTYALNDLTDVTLTSAQYGDSLVFNGSEWVNGFPEAAVKKVFEMPTASISNEGEVVLYVGDTVGSFKKNHTYMCETNGSTFWWADITVSGSGGATSLSGLSDVQLSQSIGDGVALRYDSTSGKWQNAPISPKVESRVESSATITLDPNKLYIWNPAPAELDISLNVNHNRVFAEEFHFMFISGSTPTELSLPSDVITPDDFSIEANKVYEISILDSLLLYNSWTIPEEEP